MQPANGMQCTGSCAYVRVAQIRIISCDLSFVLSIKVAKRPKNSAHHQFILVISPPAAFVCFRGLCSSVPQAVSHYVDIAYSFDCVLYLDMARKHILSSAQQMCNGRKFTIKIMFWIIWQCGVVGMVLEGGLATRWTKVSSYFFCWVSVWV